MEFVTVPVFPVPTLYMVQLLGGMRNVKVEQSIGSVLQHDPVCGGGRAEQ